MYYFTDEETLDRATSAADMSLIDICKKYRNEHQSYWYLVDSGKYPNFGTDDGDYRAKHHWRRVKALRKRIKEQGEAEGINGWEFYSAHLGD